MNESSPHALRLTAPAKLNLWLHVNGRRDDGYHLLQTVFQLLDWGDRIDLRRRDDGRIVRQGGLSELSDEDDLAIRAARLLREASGSAAGADIRIVKRIPAGAGLGGGSSDAATVLLGLNRLWRLDWPLQRLAGLGLRLGADVPVFVAGRSAFAEGVGEALTPVDLPQRWYVVVWPGVPVATSAVFQAPELTRNTPALTISALSGTPSTRNDLQPVAIRLCPVIDEVLAWLSQWGEARMSGSGSGVFLPVPDEDTAHRVVAASAWPAWAAQGVNVSPTLRELEAVAGADQGVGNGRAGSRLGVDDRESGSTARNAVQDVPPPAAATRRVEQVRAGPGTATWKSRQDARPSTRNWGVAKLVRHGILIPAFEGSSPSAPAIPFASTATTRVRKSHRRPCCNWRPARHHDLQAHR